MSYSLADCSFEEFVAFLFDRPVPLQEDSFAALAARGETNKWQPWYYEAEVDFSPLRFCAHYQQLFRKPRFLLGLFSKARLEQGFCATQSLTLNCSARSLIWSTSVPFPFRAECVRSMLPLFAQLFADEALENSVSMWWDSFCYDWHCGTRDRSRGGEDHAMQDVMFETLSQILGLESEICQGAALHGLSHLHHPGTEEVIGRYLSEHPTLPEEWKRVALAAARFQLM